jgi:leader peptidase (prepilin peptidase)/N-methyltransferase
VRLGPNPALPAFLYLAAVGVALAVIDLDVRRLPNAIVLPSYAVASVLLAMSSVVDATWTAYLRALAGMATLFLLYFVLALAHPGGMGFGDVKLAGVLGLYLGWLGWAEVAVGTFLGFLLGGAAGVLLIVLGRATRRSAIPFGPFMLAGALAAVLWGPALAGLYADVSGL